MEFNVNNSVSVRLTDLGRDIIDKDPYGIVPKEDKDGWTEWQLWVLMQTFGEHMGNGFRVPFETTIRVPNGR